MSLTNHFVRTLLCAALALGLSLPVLAAGSGARTARGVSAGGANAGGVNAGGGPGGDAALPGEVLVKLRTSDALPALLSKYSLTLVDRFGTRPIFRLKTIGGVNANDILPALSLEPDVMIAEVNLTHSAPEARHNLPWAIGNPSAYVAQWAPRVMRLNVAQRLSTGAGVRVAVLDTGVDLSHPLLAGRLLPGFDFVDFDSDPSEVGSTANAGFGHGTHVAGLVALVAPDAKIMPIRVLDPDGVGNAWVLAEALLYAVDPDGNPATDDGAHVINLSLGSLSRTRIMAAIGAILTCKPAIPDDPIEDRSDPGYAGDAARCANSSGAVVVAAAGNDSSSNINEYPAAESAYGLMSVGASGAKQTLAAFSNSGSWIDIAGPGEGITSSVPGGGVGTWSGTSMASPLVAGTAALLRAFAPSLTPKDVIIRLRRTASTLCGGTNIGQVDAAAALSNVPLAVFRCQ